MPRDAATARTSTTPRWNTLALAATLVLAGVVPGSPVTAPARAGEIQRCAAPDGSTVYTDKPCAALGASAIAMPGELVARLVDARQADAAGGTPAGAGGYVDASLPLHPGTAAPAYARRSAADGCARSPTQLAMDLQGAFALGDVNRIAESWHWVGMDHQAAMHVMERLERMGRSNVVDTQYFDAAIAGSGIGTWADAGAAPAAGGGVMQLTLGGEGGHQVLDLRVERYEGCFFVGF